MLEMKALCLLCMIIKVDKIFVFWILDSPQNVVITCAGRLEKNLSCLVCYVASVLFDF